MQSLILLALPASTLAGSVLWSGIWNSTDTVDTLDKWSWSNQVGAYQWYIHGDSETSEYVGLSSDFKNPAASDAQGARITIDSTSSWNGQTMLRSELIPQTSADLGSGHLYYHFSLSTKEKNAPNPSFEHQIAFFESHFTELKYGSSGGSDNSLSWYAGGESKWSVQLEAGKWYNFAYDLDFDSNTVGLWASNGSEPLTQVVEPVSASVSTNSADWHVGELRLPGSDSDDAAEDWYWSGVYIEEAPITKEIGSGSSDSSDDSSASSSTSSAVKSAQPSATESTAAATTATPTQAATQTSSSAAAPAVTSASAAHTTVATASSTAQAVTSSAAPQQTEVATSTSSSAAAFSSPTSSAEFMEDIKALITVLLSRANSGSVHARDFRRA